MFLDKLLKAACLLRCSCDFPLSFSAITLLEMFATTLGKIMLRRLELRKTLKCLKLRTCYICLLKLNFITRFASLADHTT